MHTRPTPSRLHALSLLLAAAASHAAFGDVSITTPGVSVIDRWHACPGGAGGEPADYCETRLRPLAHIPSLARNSAPDRILRQAYPNWTITQGENRLDGIVNVSAYDAHLCDPYALNRDFRGYRAGDDPASAIDAFRQDRHCTHGASIIMDYTPGPGDGTVVPQNATMYWLQFVEFTGGYCETYYPLDIPIVDNARDTSTPFYFGPRDQQDLAANNRASTWFFDAPENGCQYANDHCGGRCPQQPGGDHWSMTFRTYLCFSVPGTTELTICDGISWGIDAGCYVPAPLTAAPLAGLLVARRRTRRAA
jgi:hypothetical protein